MGFFMEWGFFSVVLKHTNTLICRVDAALRVCASIKFHII